MTTPPELSLPEWTVLTVLSQQPAHGFAVAALTGPQAELGRVWHIPRPVVYRAMGRLAQAGLITPQWTEPGLGPQRTIFAATLDGRQAAQHWLNTPVQHIRDIRSQLLLKLALLDRAGIDPTDLLRQQRAILEPIAGAIEAGPPPPQGFDATLQAWRRASATAALDFLDTVTPHELHPAPRRG
jgi:DNA-binding PadR family transcriptional regulator